MTWRRFTALLRGLGPSSATVSRAGVRRALGQKREKVVTITTPEDAERAFSALFSTAKQSTH